MFGNLRGCIWYIMWRGDDQRSRCNISKYSINLAQDDTYLYSRCQGHVYPTSGSTDFYITQASGLQNRSVSLFRAVMNLTRAHANTQTHNNFVETEI